VQVLRRGLDGPQVGPRAGALLALALILVAPLLLVLHLGQPLRFWHLYVLPNLGSPLSLGTFFLSFFVPLAALHLAALLLRRAGAARLTALLGLPLALLVQGYTPFILLCGRGRPLWDSVLIPPLFLVSALAAGIASVVLAGRCWLALVAFAPVAAAPATPGKDVARRRAEEQADLHRLGTPLCWALATLLLLLLGLLGSLALGGAPSRLALGALLGGGHVWALAGLLLPGTVLPLLLLRGRSWRSRPGSLLLAGAGALLGALALRLIVLVSGQALPLV
ncbi:MAG: hypothetical protein FJ125_15385, partial [Deltaproteobacteria bacterium]|nr:hypothetical protein [Deltaproteobacteria bacterium]